MAEINLLPAIPLLIGLFFVGVAMFERGYKTFLEKKKEDPTLKFDHTYLLNLWVSTGASSTIVAIVTALMSLIPEQEAPAITFYSIITNALIGYTTAYTILDKLNTGTETKFALLRAGLSTTTTVEKTETGTTTPS